LLERADAGERGRLGIERVVLHGGRRAGRVDPGDALGDHRLDAGGQRGVDEVARALDAQACIRGAVLPSEVGELLDDDVGRGASDGSGERRGVVGVGDDRARAGLDQLRGTLGAAGRAPDLVAGT
jgi:hypothetical protein